MSKLLDFIKNKPMLKRLYRMLELGIGTIDWKLLQTHLNEFDVKGDILTAEQIAQFQKNVADDMTSQGCSQRDILGIGNIILIYGMTAVTVQDEIVLEKDVNVEFATKFYDYAKDCFEKTKQEYSSKILAKELSKQDSYYLRTLDVFFMADKFELDWFFEITKYIIDQAYVPEFILHDNKFYPFNQFQTLIDSGFINSSTGSISFNETTIMRLSKAEIKIEIPKPPIRLSIYTLTDAGSQLYDLRIVDSTEDYLHKIKEVFENRQAKVLLIDCK